MRQLGTISAMTLNNSKSAQQTISNLAKYARLSLLCGVFVLATLLLFADPEANELWLSNFILTKIAAVVFYTVIYQVAKYWDNKNLLSQL